MARGVKTGGRQKGTPNKLTGDLRDMIGAALEAVGGRKYLERQAEANPQAFMALVGRCLPKDISAEIHGSVTLQVVTGVPSSGG